MKKIVVILLLCLTTIGFSQEKVLLRLNYKKGDVYKVEMKMMNDMGNSNFMNMNFTMSQEIKSVINEEYTAEAKINKIIANVSQSGVSIKYDSSKKEEELDAMAKMMKPQIDPILNTLIMIKGDKLGKIIETKTIPSLPQTSNLTSQANNVVYPKETVKIGDTWNSMRKENGLDFNYTYKVISITPKNVMLDVVGKISGMGNGDLKGKIDIDKSTGIPSESKLDMDIDVKGNKIKTSVILLTTKM